MLQKLPFHLAILGMIGGVFVAILFGINEDMFKSKINEGLSRNVKIQEINDPVVKEAKIKSEADKNWRYYQRFHFHATGIGSMSLALLTFLIFIGGDGRAKIVVAYATSVGGFLYPFVWLFAGLFGPEMGRDEAKESFAFFGYMGGLFLLGAIGVLVLSIVRPVRLKI